MDIIDIHAHVFPAIIAQKAANSIADFYRMGTQHDGTVKQLLEYSEEAGISRTCIHSVAVTPQTVPAINRFISESVQANPERLTGYAAIHPDDPELERMPEKALQAGLRGFKIHPDMQRFALDSEAAMRMFSIIEGKLPIIIHTGDYRYEYSRPWQMKKVLDAFPRLVCVCAHLGGWSEWWTEAWNGLAGYENVYVDTSSSLYAMTRDNAVSVIRHYSRERVLFGTDFPMWNPKEELKRFLALGLTSDEEERILSLNAERLLRLGDAPEPVPEKSSAPGYDSCSSSD